MTMKFKKFESIDNTSRLKTLNYIIEHGFSGGIWVATEKVDGTNFSMWTDGDEFRVGKRNSMLHDNELDGFFNCRAVVEKYEGKVRSLFSELRLRYDCKDVRVYGEMYGGYYPGAEPEHAPGASKIQSDKVFYMPHNDFIAFDLQMDGKYVNTLDALETLEAFHIPTVPILGIGSFEEMLAVPNDSESQISFMHKMKRIDPARFKGMWGPDLNIIEGVVLRPDVPASFGSGSRVILKNKNPRFSEGNNTKVPKIVKPMTDEQREVYQTMYKLVTENRIRNAISKFGPVGQKDFGKLLGMVNKDVIEEHLGDDLENGLNSLDKSDRKLITKMINGDIALIIRDNFQNIIDSMF